MSKQCSSGGLLKCSFGVAPTALNVLPVNQVLSGTPAANIMDNKPFVNIPTFGMCTSPANPAVIACFGAPAPCVPAVVTPWLPGAVTTLIGNIPAVNDKSKCLCAYGGAISVNFAGQVAAETK
jgi:hypothetical protein